MRDPMPTQLVHARASAIAPEVAATAEISVPEYATVAQAIDLARAQSPSVAEALGSADVVAVVDGMPLDSVQVSLATVGNARVIHAAPAAGEVTTIALFAIGLVLSAVSSFVLASTLAPSFDSGDTPEEQRRTFGRISADAFAGDTIPVFLGSVPNAAGKRVGTVPLRSPDGNGDDKLLLLYSYGHGPIDAIGDLDTGGGWRDASDVGGIYLNDQPVSAFPGVRVVARLGAANQGPIDGFQDTVVIREVGAGAGVTLVNTSGSRRTGDAASGEAFTFTTSGDVDRVRPVIEFPAGLFRLAGNQIEAVRRQYRLRFRRTDIDGSPGAWSGWKAITLERGERSRFESAPTLELGPRAQYDIQAERIDPDDDAVDVESTMVWISLEEITDALNTYPGQALLGLEITASEQLQGIPNVTADVRGFANCPVLPSQGNRNEPDFDESYSDNPAWCALAVLNNEKWGFGAQAGLERVDLQSFIEWAETCDEDVPRVVGEGTRKRYRFGMRLDQAQKPADVLRTICRAGRAIPVLVGERWRVVGFRPQSAPVEVFTDGSIEASEDGVPMIRYTREVATGGLARGNQIVVQYLADARDGEPETIRIPEDGTEHLETEAPRPVNMRLDGVGDDEQAYARGRHELKKLLYLSRSVVFTPMRPVLALQAGERFDLASQTLALGTASGRLRSASLSSVVLDRTVTLEVGTTYVITVLHPGDTREMLPVASPAGTYAAGDTIDLSGSFATVPEAFTEYALGASGLETKPFLATRVGLTDADQMRWEIEGVEYDERIDDDDELPAALPDYTDFGDVFRVPGPVEQLAASIAGQSPPSVLLTYRQASADVPRTASFRVYRRRVGAFAWIRAATPSIGATSTVVDVPEADFAYEFAVVAVGTTGRALSPDDPSVPTVTLAAGLGIEPPPPPASPAIAREADGTYAITADAVDGASGYQFLEGGASGFVEPSPAGPNSRAQHCLVLERAAVPALDGLHLAPGIAHTYSARTDSPQERLRSTATRTRRPRA